MFHNYTAVYFMLTRACGRDRLSISRFALWAVNVGQQSGALLLLLLLLLKSVEFDGDVALLLSVAGLVMGPHVTSESEIGSTDSAALRTSRACRGD